MSSPIRYGRYRDDPVLKYAPPRVRDRALSAPTEPSLPDGEWPCENAEWAAEEEEFEGDPTRGHDQAIQGLSAAMALEPERVPAPPERHPNNRSAWKIVLRLCGAAGLAAFGAWFMVLGPIAREFAGEGFRRTSLGVPNAGDSNKQDLLSDAAATRRRPNRSDVEDDSTQGAVEEPRIYPRLATASAGAGTAVITPPAPMGTPGPPSPVQSAAQGQLATPIQSAAAVPVTPPIQSAAAVPVTAPIQSAPPDLIVKHLDRDEIASLIKRGESFISSGDLSSARLLLRRAAEAGAAQAALELGGTFDPNLIEGLGVNGLAADIAQARLWYQHAEQFGSTEATRRLQQLAARVETRP